MESGASVRWVATDRWRRTYLRTRIVGLRSVEICAGAGGQAIGLEQAGFEHVALVEIDPHACLTLRENRPAWNVVEGDVRSFDGRAYEGVDLLAGGVPCPPFSMGGKRLGDQDERDLFPEVLRLTEEMSPAAVMIENVRGLLTERFASYRAGIRARLHELGYETDWRLVRATDFGLPQARERSILIGLDRNRSGPFSWPEPTKGPKLGVGPLLRDLMAANGWTGADLWADTCVGEGPTLTGGSKKHGGADLGPTRTKRIWESMGVDPMGVADAAPGPAFEGPPKLTVRMAARLQGFPDEWTIVGRKTAAYRQVGNAFPPPVAKAVGEQLAKALAAAPVLARTG